MALGKEPPKQIKVETEKKLREQQDYNSLSHKQQDSNSPSREQQRASLIDSLLSTREGRQRLAASMIEPLRLRLDRGSIARHIFHVDVLPTGASAAYDIEKKAYYVNGFTENEYHITSTSPSSTNRYGILVSSLNFNNHSSINMTNLRSSRNRLNLIEGCQDIAYQEIRNQEQAGALALLDAVTIGSNNIINEEKLSHLVLTKGFSLIERKDLRVNSIFMNALNFSSVRCFSPQIFNHETSNESMLRGIMGALFGAQVFISRAITPGHIYLTARPEQVGIMPIMANASCISSDNPNNHSIDFEFSETIGLCCLNTDGVAKIIIS